eukprot:14788957-Alexandrium_andersonii.AAC.1
MWNEIVLGIVDRNCREQVSREALVTVNRSSAELRKVYKDLIAMTEARCLYDQLSRDCPGLARDRRCAIEMRIIKDELCQTNGTARWVDHPAMPMGAMT